MGAAGRWHLCSLWRCLGLSRSRLWLACWQVYEVIIIILRHTSVEEVKGVGAVGPTDRFRNLPGGLHGVMPRVLSLVPTGGQTTGARSVFHRVAGSTTPSCGHVDQGQQGKDRRRCLWLSSYRCTTKRYIIPKADHSVQARGKFELR